MTDNGPQHVNVRTFRSDIKEILDGTRFLSHHYVVTRHGQAVAQLVPLDRADGEQDPDDITVTQVRIRTREILEAVCHRERTFLIVRHGRPEAILCPLQTKEHEA